MYIASLLLPSSFTGAEHSIPKNLLPAASTLPKTASLVNITGPPYSVCSLAVPCDILGGMFQDLPVGVVSFRIVLQGKAPEWQHEGHAGTLNH